MRTSFLVLTLCLTFLFSASTAQAERRVALVVGNASYAATTPLANPGNDATAVSAALARLGFEVLLGIDKDTAGLRALIRDFSAAADGADLALFYYAGHGLQVGGRNYLIPVDAALEREADLDFAAIDLQLVLRQMERGAKNSIVLLDACRDNPFETQLSRSMGATRSSALLGRGLAPVETLGGALIGFATDPGEVAYDGAGQHSPFTEALLTHVETPGLEINTLMTRVRADVVLATDRRQRPWATSSLLNELYLAPETPAEPANTAVLDELAAWRAAEATGTPEGFQDYLTQYPGGLFAQDATDRLAALVPPAEQTTPLPAPPLPRPDRAAAPADIDGFQLVPSGGFQMGSDGPETEPAERPTRRVDVGTFLISKTEITVAEYGAFVEASGYKPGAGCYIWTEEGRMRWRDAAGWQAPGVPVSDDLPVACVNWTDASAYAAWLGKTLNRTVRLPSEAELEYVIRAGTTTPYPFEGGAEGACGAVNAADASSRFQWRNTVCSDGMPTIAATTDLPANAFGLAGITGNLWEWAADCWNPTHQAAPADATPRLTGQCGSRVLKGGSWDDPLKNLRSSYRVAIPLDRRQANIGFRVVIEVQP